MNTIVFDLDGTFADTADDIIRSLNFCLSNAGLSPISRPEIGAYVGQGGRVMIARAFERQNIPLSSDHHDTLCDIFLDHYRQNIPGTTAPYEGVIDVIGQFRDAGFRTAICTNKFETLATSLIEAIGHSDMFDAITGSDTFPFRKPDPRHLTETIAAAGGESCRSIMVGDSSTDIETAKAANIPVIAVDFGYSPEPVEIYNPSHIISHYSELTLDLAKRLLER